ncbi:nitrate ABC transporter substrate-binding protein [Microlunatus endophyticus]|uniref:Nitrate ABC transporter substrate-binding protein n=2 Tax=Microlunatus endophyticus TaxID=1716077 RepID=A0A917SHG0_9ACTN|nr:nitrate ABC transporter substrate-binding protein [Microlunatus endophyticus]
MLSMKKLARAVAVLLATTGMAVLAACSGGGSSAQSSGAEGYTLRIGTTSTTGTPAGNIGWGDKKGILKSDLAAAGVTNIKYSYFQSGADIVSALLAGAVDVAAVGDTPGLSSKGNGGDVTLLSLDSYNEDMWLVGAKGGPTTIQGLAGKSVAAATGTQRDRSIRQLLDLAGLTTRVTVSNLGTPQALAALKSGKIAGTVLGGADAYTLTQQGYPVLDRLSKHKGLGGVGTDVALKSFVSKHPGFEKAWQNAIVSINRDILGHFDDYLTWVSQLDGISVALERKGTDRKTFNTEPYPAAGIAELQTSLDFLEKQGDIKKPYKVADWVAESSGDQS